MRLRESALADDDLVDGDVAVEVLHGHVMGQGQECIGKRVD